MLCYKSSKLNEHEKSYVFHDVELVSIILMSYHSGLRYLVDQTNLNARKAR